MTNKILVPFVRSSQRPVISQYRSHKLSALKLGKRSFSTLAFTKQIFFSTASQVLSLDINRFFVGSLAPLSDENKCSIKISLGL